MNRYEFYSSLQTYKKQHEDDSLTHYGIIGQKWGTRRWQNQDGTFNEAGKERYFGTGKKNNNNKEEENKKWLDRAEEYTNRLQKAKTYKDIDKIENEILKDEHVKPYFDKAKEIYDKTGDWNKAEEYLMKTPIHEEDWIYDMMDSHITNWNQKIGSVTLAERNPEVEKAITGSINKRNADMKETENEDMLIGASPEKKAYKAKVKELKAQAKEMGVPFGERGHLAKYCAKNGIDEITDKIVQGHKAGDDLWNDSIRMNNATDQIDHFVQHTKRGEHVRSDKNVKEFTENNKNFKDFQKNVEKMNKTLKKANDELISKLKKAGLDLDPILVDSNNEGKTVRLDYYKEGSKEYQILNKAFQEVYKGSMQTEFKKYAKEARESLGHFEKDCHDFAKEYLVDQAEYNDPYRYAFTYEKDTGKTRSTKMYETYGYLMTEPYWNEVGGP